MKNVPVKLLLKWINDWKYLKQPTLKYLRLDDYLLVKLKDREIKFK